MYRSQWLLFDFLSFFSKPILHVSREVNSDTPLVLFYRICFAWIKSVFLNTILVLYNFNPTCTAVPVFLGLPSFHFAISSSLCRASMYQWCAAKFLYNFYNCHHVDERYAMSIFLVLCIISTVVLLLVCGRMSVFNDLLVQLCSFALCCYIEIFEQK